MVKGLKLKFCRVITSFNSCRSKDPAYLPFHPVPSFLKLSPVEHHLPPPQPPSIKRHISSTFTSISCRFRSSESPPSSPPSPPPPEFQWKQEKKWHVVAKILDQDNYTTPHRKSLLPPPPPTNTAEKKKQRIRREKNVSPRVLLRLSNSSSDGDDQNRSFSTDYKNKYDCKEKKKKVKRGKRYVSRNMKNDGDDESLSSSSPARLSRFQWLIPCTVEGKVKESFAVVKKSEEPYEDFKRSMMEMIMEKQMFEAKDLEQLLQCFLSLNSGDHHGIIVQAFCEIWEALFCN
ncbi:transcription repressor OFP7 [Mercurialis annua]|uniref:transcription repressor OFP7 n=1 Tax=Mercurialis annua TaxID=3986 RepID=UPI002160004E|nr:transcription repressor OFP7 [Mercurialis annua]